MYPPFLLFLSSLCVFVFMNNKEWIKSCTTQCLLTESTAVRTWGTQGKPDHVKLSLCVSPSFTSLLLRLYYLKLITRFCLSFHLFGSHIAPVCDICRLHSRVKMIYRPTQSPSSSDYSDYQSPAKIRWDWVEESEPRQAGKKQKEHKVFLNRLPRQSQEVDKSDEENKVQSKIDSLI